MYGAFLGDMIGAPYEFDQGDKTKVFPLFTEKSLFTDDSVMTAAVAEALMDTFGCPEEQVKAALVRSMQKWGRRYPDAGYGCRFMTWLYRTDPKPYGSFGNGSAMRVSAAGWLYETLEQTRRAARWTSEVTHDHPEGIKAAEAVASAIYMARTGKSLAEIRDFIEKKYYVIDFTLDEIRPDYRFDVTCQGSVPQAFEALFESIGFEDAIRNAVSLGGDSDTIGAITGGMAQAVYGVPLELREKALTFLDRRQTEILLAFEDRFGV